MIFRSCRSASSMPAAVQRSAISPDDQRFTLRWVRRTISIIDSHGFVLSSVRLQGAADVPTGGSRPFLMRVLFARAILALRFGMLLNTLSGRPPRALAAYDGRCITA